MNYLYYQYTYREMEIAPKEQDRRAVEQLKEGSKAAFHHLFDTYGPKIFAFAMSHLRNEAEAEELLQEVFLKLWEVRENLDSSKNIKSFLFKICINLIYDFIRKKNLSKAYVDYSVHNPSFSCNNTWQEVIYHDMINHLQCLVAHMPEQRQRIFRLSKEEGLSVEDIALKLNLSPRTVENHLYRAVSFLKEKLAIRSIPALLFYFLHIG